MHICSLSSGMASRPIEPTSCGCARSTGARTMNRTWRRRTYDVVRMTVNNYPLETLIHQKKFTLESDSLKNEIDRACSPFGVERRVEVMRREALQDIGIFIEQRAKRHLGL